MQGKGLECARAKQGEAKPKDTTDQGCEEEEDTMLPTEPELIEIEPMLPTDWCN